MNKTKKSIIGVLLALIMVVTCITTIGISTPKNASALTEEYYGQDDTIYYFADSKFPEVREDELSTYFTNYNIVYDLWAILTSDDLEMMRNDGYFEGFSENCIVIFELTIIDVDPAVLEDIFAILKSQGVILIFVGIYDAAEYGFDIYEYVDDYVQVSGNNLYNFICESVYDMVLNGLSSDSCIFIDGRCVDIYSFSDLCNYADIQELCEASLFLRLLLQQLCDVFGFPYDETYDEFYKEIAEDLFGMGFSILVYVEANQYVDLLASDWYDEENIYEYDDAESFSSDYGLRQYFAIGFWELNQEYYDFIYDSQNNWLYFPVYIFEIEPVTYGALGIDATVHNNDQNKNAIMDSISNFT